MSFAGRALGLVRLRGCEWCPEEDSNLHDRKATSS
jgi:hypothetical protein